MPWAQGHGREPSVLHALRPLCGCGGHLVQHEGIQAWLALLPLLVSEGQGPGRPGSRAAVAVPGPCEGSSSHSDGIEPLSPATPSSATPSHVVLASGFPSLSLYFFIFK